MNTQQSVPLALVDAVDRYFRSYETHCTAPNRDTLFNLLNAAHSLNDKLRKYGGTDILSIPEFVALKALRNFFHHEDELVSQARSIAAMDIPPDINGLSLPMLGTDIRSRESHIRHPTKVADAGRTNRQRRPEMVRTCREH